MNAITEIFNGSHEAHIHEQIRKQNTKLAIARNEWDDRRESEALKELVRLDKVLAELKEGAA